MKRIKEMPLVLVHWLDIKDKLGWLDVEDFKKDTPVLCHAVGYLYEKNKKVVKIIGTLAEDMDDNLGRTSLIPTGCIKSIEYLTIRKG